MFKVAADYMRGQARSYEACAASEATRGASPARVGHTRKLAGFYAAAADALDEAPVDLGSVSSAALGLGAVCGECGEPQHDSPSGLTCPNGHGGADSVVVVDFEGLLE